MKDLFGKEVPPVHLQRDLLAGPCGLGVNAVLPGAGAVEYVRTPSGYRVRADGTGPLIPEKVPEGGDLPLARQGKIDKI